MALKEQFPREPQKKLSILHNPSASTFTICSDLADSDYVAHKYQKNKPQLRRWQAQFNFWLTDFFIPCFQFLF